MIIVKRISLQSKIVILITVLIICITILLTIIFSFFQFKEYENVIGIRALNLATTISFMPSIINAFDDEAPEKTIQPIAEKIRENVNAEFIVIGNTDSIRYAHPDKYKIGEKMVGGDNDLALIDGEYYTSKASGTLGPSLRGKAPILNDEGKIIGIVSVGFLIEDIKSVIWSKVIKTSGISSIVLIFGVFGGILLSRNIRKDTFGLEPHEIASLYRDRNAILGSIKEGIIAIDLNGNITMMNESARKILNLKRIENQRIEDIIPNTKMYEVLQTGKLIKDDEMVLNNRTVIVNRTPINNEQNEVVGVVSSFRDKTEINEMLNTLSEIRSYSEDLRAQTHEYTNKLYVLSGLLQLKYYDEAIELIQKESDINLHQNIILTNQIKDKTVQAILLGKISKCSEKKINFIVDDNSFLNPLPDSISASKVIAILGNLIDNAIEAVEKSHVKEIHFFVTDVGNDIVFEITDSGDGITNKNINELFKQGYSTKDQKFRGFGLSIVKETVEELGGSIEIINLNNYGVVFSVFFPKYPLLMTGGIVND